MKTYTFLVEIEGGTYISQVDAKNENLALIAWCDEIQSHRLFAHRTTRLVKAVLRKKASLTLVSDLVGVWCFSTIFAGQLILGHVVLCDAPTTSV